jgi:hypothetical protein
MMKPPEIWTPERLEQAMLDEATRHGASQCYIEQLKAQFQNAEHNKLTNDDTRSQIGEIPS